jgi:protein arginine N-methyltransferase 1
MLIPTVIDARRRFLVPGGILIPSEEHLFAAVVEHPEAYSRFSSPWQDHPYDINMHAALKYTLNSGEKTKIVPEQLLAPALLWATLDYTTISNTNHQADFHFLIERDGIAHGLGNWFETALVPGVSLSNAPGEPELIYGQLFLPFTAPILVKVGDTLTVHLRADLVDGDYIWSWNTRHQRQGQPEMEGWDFEQSTLYSHPITLDKIKKKASRFIPTLSENGLVERTILDKMDGSHSLAEIAQFLTERFPSHFPTWQDALARAASVSSKYSR